MDTVEEGEAAVFVLTRAGMTNGALAMQVRLRSPGRLQMLDARFEPGAVTTEIAVATHNNNLVDYPSVRDYTIEVFGDGAPLGQDDRSFTPGAPATATVKVTDDDELINVTVYPVKAIISRGKPVLDIQARRGHKPALVSPVWVLSSQARQEPNGDYLRGHCEF